MVMLRVGMQPRIADVGDVVLAPVPLLENEHMQSAFCIWNIL